MINTTNGNGNGLVSFKLTNYTSQNPPKWAKHRNFFPNDQTCVFVKEITDKYQSSSTSSSISADTDSSSTSSSISARTDSSSTPRSSSAHADFSSTNTNT